MIKSSIINDRYPLKFDLDSQKNCDFILMFQKAINKNNNNIFFMKINLKDLWKH